MRSTRPTKATGVLRLVVFGVIATALVTACGAASSTRNAKLGSGPDACWASGSTCHRDSECCTFWCVNGVCEYRDP